MKKENTTTFGNIILEIGPTKIQFDAHGKERYLNPV